MEEKKYFGVMLDVSRNAVMKPKKVVEFAQILKSFGYNMIQLYTEDTYEIKDEPYFGYMRGRYSTNELKYIVSECEKIGMEVIPCIQTLGHLSQLLRWEDTGDTHGPYGEIKNDGSTLLVGEEKTYKLIEKMLKTARECFTSRYIHVGMDEAHGVELGRYIGKHGYRNGLTVLKEHLDRVIALAEKYAFKPIMWSDMFYKLATGGGYYQPEIQVTDELKNSIPQGVELVYWDYYHYDKPFYASMMQSHKKLSENVWFAGGAWSWCGFAPGNGKTLDTMISAMKAAREQKLEKIFLTLWGDDGKECSYFALLPSLFTVKKIYDGEEDMEKIKAEFKKITGEDYDALSYLDCPNYVGGNKSISANICKYAVYGDPFLNFFDSRWKAGVAQEYADHKIRLDQLKAGSRYEYIYDYIASLCDFLAVKYDLGMRSRTAYSKGDKKALNVIAKDFLKAAEKLNDLYKNLREVWYKENKPYGFEILDLRLGGLKQRLISCGERLTDYAAGKIENIPELDEPLISDYAANAETFSDFPNSNFWSYIVSPGYVG